MGEEAEHLIRVYDGISTNNTLLGSFTRPRKLFSVQSTGHFMFVKLLKGYLFDYCAIEGEYVASTLMGEFTSIINSVRHGVKLCYKVVY